MPEVKEENEVTVRAPPIPIIDSEKKAQKISEKALEEERYEVLRVSHRISKYFGSLSIVTGIFLVIIGLYTAITGQSDILIPASPSFSAIILLWFAVGLVSIAVGFLLMGSE